MPTDESAKARANEQEVNNAHQGRNDAQQGRNDAESGRASVKQDQTNKNQAKTNSDQENTNTAQGATNATQADINSGVQDSIDEMKRGASQASVNSEQGDTNTAQKVTNTNQEDINSGVQDSIDEMKVDASQASESNGIILEAVRLLAENLKANTKSLTAVSEALDANQKYTEGIEKKSDNRAGTFKLLWVAVVLMILVVGVGGFALNTHRTRQLCDQRNIANASNTELIQEDIDMLKLKDPTNTALPGLIQYVSRSVQINCGSFP